jgi:catechol 2,3-dioxygenase-like lactoylglutathione lyase family enzyme
MLLYVTLGTRDLEKARAFYDAALAPLGFVLRSASADEIGYGEKDDHRTRFWINYPYNKEPATYGNGAMIALDAPSRLSVDEFYAAAIAAGGTDEGAPGLRPFHATFYEAYVRDPDGNKISAVCEKAE